MKNVSKKILLLTIIFLLNLFLAFQDVYAGESEGYSFEPKKQVFLWNAKSNFETKIICSDYRDVFVNDYFLYLEFKDKTGKEIVGTRLLFDKDDGIIEYSTSTGTRWGEIYKALKGKEGVLTIDPHLMWKDAKYIRCTVQIIEKLANGSVVSVYNQSYGDVRHYESYISVNANTTSSMITASELNITNVSDKPTKFKVLVYNWVGQKEETREVTLEPYKNVVYSYGNFANWTGNHQGRTFHIEPMSDEADYVAYIKIKQSGTMGTVFYKPQNLFSNSKLLPARGKLFLTNVYFVPSYLEYLVYSEGNVEYKGRMFIPPYFQHLVDLSKLVDYKTLKKKLKNPTIEIRNLPAFSPEGCPSDVYAEGVCHDRSMSQYLVGEIIDGKKIYTIQDKESTEGDDFEVPYVYSGGVKYINLYNRSPQQALVYLMSKKTKNGDIYEVPGLSELRVNLNEITKEKQDAIMVLTQLEDVSVTFEDASSVSPYYITTTPIKKYSDESIKEEDDFKRILPTGCVGSVALDKDKDGMCDAQEKALGINPKVKDTDKDGILDYDEVFTYFTDPLSQSTNGISNDWDMIEQGKIPIFDEQEMDDDIRAQMSPRMTGNGGYTVTTNTMGRECNNKGLMHDICGNTGKPKGVNICFDFKQCPDETKSTIIKMVKSYMGLMENYGLNCGGCDHVSASDNYYDSNCNLRINDRGEYGGTSATWFGSHISFIGSHCGSEAVLTHETMGHYIAGLDDEYNNPAGESCSLMSFSSPGNICPSNFDHASIYKNACCVKGGKLGQESCEGGKIRFTCSDLEPSDCLQDPSKGCVSECDKNCGYYNGEDSINSKNNCQMCKQDETLYRILKSGDVKGGGKTRYSGGGKTINCKSCQGGSCNLSLNNSIDTIKQDETSDRFFADNEDEFNINFNSQDEVIRAQASRSGRGRAAPPSFGQQQSPQEPSPEEQQTGQQVDEMTKEEIEKAIEDHKNEFFDQIETDKGKTKEQMLKELESFLGAKDLLKLMLMILKGGCGGGGKYYLGDWSGGCTKEEMEDVETIKSYCCKTNEQEFLARKVNGEYEGVCCPETGSKEGKTYQLLLLGGKLSCCAGKVYNDETGKQVKSTMTGSVIDYGEENNESDSSSNGGKEVCCEDPNTDFAKDQESDEYRCCTEEEHISDEHCCPKEEEFFAFEEEGVAGLLQGFYSTSKGICCKPRMFASEQKKCCEEGEHETHGYCCPENKEFVEYDKATKKVICEKKCPEGKTYFEDLGGEGGVNCNDETKNCCCESQQYADKQNECCGPDQKVDKGYCCGNSDDIEFRGKDNNGAPVCCKSDESFIDGQCKKEECEEGETLHDVAGGKRCCKNEFYAEIEKKCCEDLAIGGYCCPQGSPGYAEKEDGGKCCEPGQTLTNGHCCAKNEIYRWNEKGGICCSNEKDYKLILKNGQITCEKCDGQIMDIDDQNQMCCEKSKYASKANKCCGSNEHVSFGYCCGKQLEYNADSGKCMRPACKLGEVYISDLSKIFGGKPMCCNQTKANVVCGDSCCWDNNCAKTQVKCCGQGEHVSNEYCCPDGKELGGVIEGAPVCCGDDEEFNSKSGKCEEKTCPINTQKWFPKLIIGGFSEGGCCEPSKYAKIENKCCGTNEQVVSGHCCHVNEDFVNGACQEKCKEQMYDIKYKRCIDCPKTPEKTKWRKDLDDGKGGCCSDERYASGDKKCCGDDEVKTNNHCCPINYEYIDGKCRTCPKDEYDLVGSFYYYHCDGSSCGYKPNSVLCAKKEKLKISCSIFDLEHVKQKTDESKDDYNKRVAPLINKLDEEESCSRTLWEYYNNGDLYSNSPSCSVYTIINGEYETATKYGMLGTYSEMCGYKDPYCSCYNGPESCQDSYPPFKDYIQACLDKYKNEEPTKKISKIRSCLKHTYDNLQGKYKPSHARTGSGSDYFGDNPFKKLFDNYKKEYKPDLSEFDIYDRGEKLPDVPFSRKTCDSPEVHKMQEYHPALYKCFCIASEDKGYFFLSDDFELDEPVWLHDIEFPKADCKDLPDVSKVNAFIDKAKEISKEKPVLVLFTGANNENDIWCSGCKALENDYKFMRYKNRDDICYRRSMVPYTPGGGDVFATWKEKLSFGGQVPQAVFFINGEIKKALGEDEIKAMLGLN